MPTDYTVEAGDCISSIAYEHGHLWETVWNDGANAALKEKRKDPNVLKADDVVVIPDLRLNQVGRGTDQRHSFKLKGVPIKLQLRILKPPKPQDEKEKQPKLLDTGNAQDSILDDPEPEPGKPDEKWTNARYTLDIDGRETTGNTDGDGCIKCPIPPNARQGRLTVAPGTPEELVVELKLGHLAPITEISGVKQRLANLGYGVDDVSEDETPELAAALKAFQSANGLEVTGDLNQATRDQLKTVHGS